MDRMRLRRTVFPCHHFEHLIDGRSSLCFVHMHFKFRVCLADDISDEEGNMVVLLTPAAVMNNVSFQT